MHTEQIILWDTEFGKIHCNLAKMMKKRRLNIYQLTRMSGLKYDVITRYCEDHIMKYDASVLAKLCYCLDCEISDLMQYQKSS